MALSYREVAEILKIIDASDCEEVTLELEGVRLAVRRGGSGAPAPAQTATVQNAASAPAVPSGTSDSGMIPGVPDGAKTIRAPMIGTFYRRPEPGKDPFVEVGSAVKPGDPVCLIEVMKLFTTIEATEAGTVREIVVEDGTTVEFDQLLFVIDPE